jgi:hypothetical protein
MDHEKIKEFFAPVINPEDPFKKSRYEMGTQKNKYFALKSMQRHKDFIKTTKTINKNYNDFTRYYGPSDHTIMSQYRRDVDPSNPRYLREDEMLANVHSTKLKLNKQSSVYSGTRLNRDPYYVSGKIIELMSGINVKKDHGKRYNYTRRTIV